MNNEYQLKFQMPYIKCNGFKEKEILLLLRIIQNSRFGKNYIKNYEYGTIIYDEDDAQLLFPKVNIVDKFIRSKIHCLILNIQNSNKYDKIFIYHINYPNHSYFGFVGYNSELNKQVHIYNITYDYTDLIVNLQRVCQEK